MAETAQEAAARAAQQVIDRIRSTDEDGNPRVDRMLDEHLRTVDQLEPGQFVRVCGEWFRFEGLLGDGRMRLFVCDREFHYGPTEGEAFIFHSGPF